MDRAPLPAARSRSLAPALRLVSLVSVGSLVSLGGAACTCPPHTVTPPQVTPATPCLTVTATVERTGSSCTQPFLAGVNGCSGDLVFPAAPVGGATPTVVAPGASFRYRVLRTGDEPSPAAYTVDVTVSGQPVAISFVVDPDEP